MPRLSIDISADEHRKLKAIAALNGQSIKDYVLERTLGAEDDAETGNVMEELREFLRPRIEAAERGEFSTRSIDEIKADARRKYGSHS